jgi:Arylmalonate decarboxylase
MTQEFRVAVVATRLSGGSPPTAEVRVGFARRVRGRWREFDERRLGERYFWNTVSGPHTRSAGSRSRRRERAAYAIGSNNEAAVVSRLSRRTGTPVLATCASAVQALRVLDVERIALVHPPWFDDELNALGAAYFESEHFDVVSSASAAVSPDPRRVEAEAVSEWTSGHVGDDAQAVFIGGNGFRAAGAIATLEAAIGRPVLTSNQVLLWNVLAQTGATFEVSGFGRLFTGRISRGLLRSVAASDRERTTRRGLS